MDKKKPELLSWTSLPVIKRYSTRPLSDIIPLVFVLFAAYLDVPIHFDGTGRLLGYDEPDGRKDRMLRRLYDVTRSQLNEGKCREAEELERELQPLKGDRFKEAFRKSIEHFILCRPGVRNQPVHPDHLKEEIVNILRSHDAISIYEYGSGLGLFARAYDGWKLYCAFEPTRIHSILAELLQQLNGKNKVFYASRDYVTSMLLMGQYDTVIGSFLTPVGSGQLERKMRMEGIRTFIDSLTVQNSWRTAILLVDYNCCVGPEYEGFRSMICEQGLLESVTEVDRTLFDGRLFRSAILVLSHRKSPSAPVIFHDCVRGVNMMGRKSWLSVPYHYEISVDVSHLRESHFALESCLYLPDDDSRFDKTFNEGADTEVHLGDLIKAFSLTNHRRGATIPENMDSCIGITVDDFSNVAYKADKPTIPHEVRGINNRRSFIQGPAISILLPKDGYTTLICRVDNDKPYFVPYGSLSLIPSDNVDVSYLVSALFLTPGANSVLEGLRQIIWDTDYGAVRPVMGFNPGSFLPENYLLDILSARPVRIIGDRKKQEELMERLNSSVIEVAKTDNEYGVVLVGKPLTDVEKGALPGWLINIVAETGTLTGEGGLQELLSSDLQKPLPSINAVIVNSKLGHDEQNRIKYKGLNDAQKLSVFYPDIPFLFYADVSWEDLGDMVEYIGDNLTCRGNQFVERKDGNSLKEAVRNLRDYLDARHSPDTAVKKKYRTELEIADWLDPSGDLTSTLAEAMRDDFSFDDNLQKTEDKFGVLRKRAEMIFNDAKHKRGLLPPLDYLGQMQQLLADGEYYDNNTKRMYVLRKKDLMPPTLSCAFSYFVMIANGGTHDANGKSLDVSGYVKGAKSPNIYKSCIYILLDLLRWYESLVGESTGPQFDETLPYADDDLVKVEGKDYYYIGNVHLKQKPFLCEGIPGRAIRMERIYVEKKPRPDGPRYYAADYQIDKKLI